MANSDYVIVYTEDDGTLVRVYPADNCDLTVEEIKAKDVPEGKTAYIVNRSDLPTDKSFQDAWTYTP